MYPPQRSIGLPDVHSGYGFAIGNMAAFDMSDPTAVVSPGKYQTCEVTVRSYTHPYHIPSFHSILSLNHSHRRGGL